MSEPVGHRKFVGHRCLYRELATRQPSFLRRNLNRSLDEHERALSNRKSGAAGFLGQSNEMTANERWPAGWDALTKDMLNDLKSGHTPVLMLDGLQLRRHDAAKSKGNFKRKPSPVSDGPDWLPAANVLFTKSCSVRVSFADISIGSTHPEPHFKNTVSATIQSDGADDEAQEFQVILKEPFLIKVNQLLASVETGRIGSNKVKRSVPVNYELRLEISCKTLEDTADLMGKLESRPASHFLSLLRQGKECNLRTVWTGFPECPSPKKLLKLTRRQGHKKLELKYGAALSMGWNRRRETPLTIYNAALRRVSNPEGFQLPTPSSSAESETVTKTHSITYVFQERREYTQTSLGCPLCEHSSRKTYEYASFDRLHLHFLTHHSHFGFEVDVPFTDDESPTVRRTVRLKLVDTERSANPSAGEEQEWVAPLKPFDGSAYVRGEDSWTGHSPSSKSGKTASKRARQAKLDSPEKRRPKPPDPVSTMLSADGIQDLPLLPKIRLKVPSVPGIRFYRTLSKRPFDSDESVAESDNEVDESWLVDRLRDDRASLELTPAAQEFLDDYNAFVEFERFPADVLIKSGIARFARTFSAKLTSFGWRREFEEKLAFLSGHGIIDQETVEYCLNLPASPDAEADASLRLANHTNRNTSRDAASTPNVDARPAVVLNVCSCGVLVTSSRGSVICDNHKCSRVQFHMSCVGLQHRPEGWRCPDCVIPGT